MLFKRRFGVLRTGESPTAVLSVNRFVTGFIFFFIMYFYGCLLEPFNHYLVWPRVLAMGLVFVILFQIYWDRRTRLAAGGFFGCVAALIFSLVIIPLIRPLDGMATSLVSALIIGLSLVYLQGAVAQILAIRRARRTGGLSAGMHVLFALEDASLIVFAITMGWHGGWPVLLLAFLGLITQIATLWHFRWARQFIPTPGYETDRVVAS